MELNRPDRSLILVEDLMLSYGSYQVLEKVSFDVLEGACTVIMGGSGCGKSTLMKSLIGLLQPRRGKIMFKGQNLWNCSLSEREKILLRFGVLFQGSALWSSMTILENVCLPLEAHADLSDRDMIDLGRYKLNLVGLSGFENFYPSELSGGMKKRAGIARAMVLDPEILFFDEPSAGLDPVSSKRLDDLINELKENAGVTFVVVTHELSSIYEIADDSVFLDPKSKTVLARGHPNMLLRESDNPDVISFLKRQS